MKKTKVNKDKNNKYKIRYILLGSLKTFSFVGILFFVNSINIKPSKTQVPQDLQPNQTTIPGSLISIEVDTSRAEVSAGVGLGITAKINNNSDKSLYFKEDSLTLTYPLELEGPYESQYGYQSFFPTEANQPDKYDEIQLLPRNSYSVIWSFNPIPKDSFPGQSSLSPFEYTWEVLKNELYYLFFQPGDYKIVLNVKYWLEPTYSTNGYRSETEDITVKVKAPQSVILIGAAIGGICAYFVTTYTTKSKNPTINIDTKNNNYQKSKKPNNTNWISSSCYFLIKKVSNFLIFLRDILGAMLLSSIVTILLSRIADTQFIVSVKVEDFWGAIATGFVANYAGISFLKQLTGAPDNINLSKNSISSSTEILQDKSKNI